MNLLTGLKKIVENTNRNFCLTCALYIFIYGSTALLMTVMGHIKTLFTSPRVYELDLHIMFETIRFFCLSFLTVSCGTVGVSAREDCV